MSELYNEDIFTKRGGGPTPPKSGSNNLLLIAGILLAVIALSAILYWKMTHNPATMILDVNKATSAQLEYLPGVGKVTAGAIINGRPYQSIEDLKKVKGIGEKNFEKMKPRIKVE